MMTLFINYTEFTTLMIISPMTLPGDAAAFIIVRMNTTVSLINDYEQINPEQIEEMLSKAKLLINMIEDMTRAIEAYSGNE